MSKCLQGKSSGHKRCGRKLVTTKRDDRKMAKLVCSDRFQNCGGNCPAVECWWCACIMINNLSQNKGNVANHIPRVKPLLNFKQCKKRLTWAMEKCCWTVGQWSRVIFSHESKFCISFETEDHEFGRSPTKLTSPVARNAALNFHKAPWSGDIMGRNVSSWS